MKTKEKLSPEVVASSKRALAQQQDALALTIDVLGAWESVESTYLAGKASWPPEMKLRFRRMAERTRQTLMTAKAAFLDTDVWLQTWENEGKRRMQLFASLGAAIPPFEPTPAGGRVPVSTPISVKAIGLIDQALDHFVELVWDGDLYETYIHSQEARS